MISSASILATWRSASRSVRTYCFMVNGAGRCRLRTCPAARSGIYLILGGWRREHAAPLAKVLARIDRLSADIDDLSEVIERLLTPYEEQLAQAESRPGWARRAA
jgi:hypothetical protein